MLNILTLLLTLLQTSVSVATYIDVQPSSTEEGISLIKQYRDASRRESGNSRVEVVREIARPNHFVIIEVWTDQKSFDTHEASDNTARFRARLKAIHNSPFDQRVHLGFAIDSRAWPSLGRDSVSVVTHVDVPPQRTAETEVLLKKQADESRKDEGSVRYEVLQQTNPRTNHLTVFEVWQDRKAFDSHETKAHTRQFRESLGPMLGAPYDERLYSPLP